MKPIFLIIHCGHFNININCDIIEAVGKYIIQYFIKSVVFQHVGIPCLIQSKEKMYFNVDEAYSHWIKYGPW